MSTWNVRLSIALVILWPELMVELPWAIRKSNFAKPCIDRHEFLMKSQIQFHDFKGLCQMLKKISLCQMDSLPTMVVNGILTRDLYSISHVVSLQDIYEETG